MDKTKKKGKFFHNTTKSKFGGAGNGSSDDSFEKLLEESFKPVRNIAIGDEIEAKVISIDHEHIYLDLRSRFDGMLRKAEVQRNGKLLVNEGDKITVFVTSQGDGSWNCTCKPGAFDANEQDPKRVSALLFIEDAFNSNKPIEGKVMSANKGGFEVEMLGIKTFCPLSQIDISYCDSPEEHINKIYTFEVIQYDEEKNNIVVSRKEYLKHEAGKKTDKLWEEIQEGNIYKGTVKSVQDFGAFIDIGGVEGLLHISEISYKRVLKVEDFIKPGQTLDVSIKEIDRIKRKVSFTLKNFQEDPWESITRKLKQGEEYAGKVIRIKTFGAFVELFPGIDGMVHISRLGTGRVHQHPKEVLKIGDMVTVRVMEIDETNRRISLTMEKEESDYTDELEKLKKSQTESMKSSPSNMSTAFDSALKKE